MKTPPVLTVTQLNTYIKSVIDSDLNLNNVFLQGEISNFTNHYRTGHYYMSIKDGESSIKAVMFKYSNQRLRFMPENGMSVILRGRVSVFERDGQYQLYIDDMQPDGAGALALAFEQLKQKLASQGLFDPDKKKPIPFMPKRIGVVTSNTGAAIHDIINVISRRFPMTELIVAPVQVQGASAAGQIARAIREFNLTDGADVLIVGRGGGSAEDLWAFNEEIVALAIADSDIPVISAVGHETDFTICDFVADLRAPTPSAAAELAVPDWREQKLYVEALFNQCKETLLMKIQNEEDNLRFIQKRLEYTNPLTVIENKIQTLDILSQKIYDKVRENFATKSGEFAAILAKLDALNPMKVMQRGYAIAYKNEMAVTSVSNINTNDKLKIRLLDGSVNVTVDSKESN
ncbi:MAG: exodeoxyribonuclease VII large subunit [Clostridia bacterium]|nr:exodeoxyribonuclease VII large subunit [Clostridia bacterium]